jgi:hypothetical protein
MPDLCEKKATGLLLESAKAAMLTVSEVTPLALFVGHCTTASAPFVPLVFVPVNLIIAAPIEAEIVGENVVPVCCMVTVTAPVLAPLVANARQAWIRRPFVLKTTPPGVPISVKVNPAPLTLSTGATMSTPRPQSCPLAQAVEVKAM